MIKSIAIVVIVFLTCNLSHAQDTLRVMSYNLLNFPNGRNDCGTNLQLPERWDTLRKIIQYAKPDIFMVCELQTQAGADSILNRSLNVNGINYYAKANFVINKSSGVKALNNCFFYNTDKVILKSQSEVLTDLRDWGEYVVYIKDPNLAVYNDTTFIYFYESHLKAGNFNSPDEENRRNVECTALRNHLDTKPAGGNYIIGGDFNFYTSTEPGYTMLTTGGTNKLNDPVNSPGDWSNNSSFVSLHSQSTRSNQNIECGAVGGMDDRFDFLMISDSVITGGTKVKYIPGTYKALGNDGNHFNKNVNLLPNSAVPDSVASALYYFSDHMPVMMDIEITYPNVLGTALLPTNINCNGNCSGVVAATAAGGTAPYTYKWNDPASQTTATATGLCPGTYRITVTDNLGGSVIDSANITEPALLTLSAGDSSVVCTGDSLGTATATVSGGTIPYFYLWNDPLSQTTSTATGLSAGEYTVIITDNNTCKDSALYAIIESSSSLFANITNTINVLCNGKPQGSATVSASGGNLPYTYLWNDNKSQSDSVATGLISGTYITTVTDSVGCLAYDTVTITQPAPMALTIIDTAQATCGFTDTQAEVNVSGGTLSYTYLWDDPASQTTSIATGLASGAYMITATDGNGCVDSAIATLKDMTSPSATITDTTHVSCYGTSTGAATVTPSGGTPPYTYTWSPSGGNDSTANLLTAGIYNVTVADANSCKIVLAVTITEPPEFTASVTDSSDVLCLGDSSGSAIVTPVGGTLPYTYFWSNGNNDSIAENLKAGGYTVIVMDAASCKANEGPGITSCFEITSILIDACNPVVGTEGENEMVRFEIGSVNLDTSDISVNWPNNSWKGICQNSTTADIVDSINANITGGGSVLEPTGGVLPAGSIVMLATSTNFEWQAHDWSGLDYTIYLIFQCSGNTNGHFKNADCACGTCGNNRTLIINFGASCSDTVAYVPCDLQNSGTGGDGAAVKFDAAGNPTYVNDSCVPPVVLSIPPLKVTISQPASALNSIISDTNDILCFGESSGSATVITTGGTTPYTYLWNDPASQTDTTATGLPAGAYTAMVTDNNGCIDSAGIEIMQPGSAITASVTAETDVLCNGDSNGKAVVNGTGGAGLYTYSWDDPSSQTNDTAYALVAGNYIAAITDANGCMDTAMTSITQPSAIDPAITAVIDENCGLADGMAFCTPAGGVLPYTYTWSNGDNDSIADSLSAGKYTVTVTDAAGCMDSVSIDIIPLDGPAAVITDIINNGCAGQSLGSAIVLATYGTPNYTYLWNDPASQTTDTANGLPEGVYNVTVTDASGCTATAAAALDDPAPLSIVKDSTDITCFGYNDGTGTSSPSGGTGPYTYQWDDPSSQTDSTASGLSTGTYMITVTDAKGCMITDSIKINEPVILSTVIDRRNVLCNGDSNGITIVTANGGVFPYTYLWDDAGLQTNDTAYGLSIGMYRVTVTDANGCAAKDSADISQPSPISLTINSANASCGGLDGMAWVDAVGGTLPYTYLWSDAGSQTNDTASGLSFGIYEVFVTDSNVCIDSATAIINEIGAAAVSIDSVSDVLCKAGSTGAIYITVTGGSAPYTYTWSDNSTTEDISSLAAGNYNVTVTDFNNCNTIADTAITEPPSITVNINSVINTDCGSTNGSIAASATGGTSPYMFSIDTVTYQPSGTFSGLSDSNYTVTVLDFNACMTSATTVVGVNGSVTIFGISGKNVSCFGGSNGSVKISASGNAPLQYSVSGIAVKTDSVFNNLSAGNYKIVVNDSLGCFDTASIVITEPPAMMLFTTTLNETCVNANDGVAFVNVSGGVIPYIYNWSQVNGNDTIITNLPEGQYIVTVVDFNNCSKKDTAHVELASGGCLEIPSSFSPNGDNKNDSWVIRGISKYPEITVEVYNRWGSLIYQSEKGYSEPWDGTFNTKPVASAVYYYIIILDTKEEPLTGTITVVK